MKMFFKNLLHNNFSSSIFHAKNRTWTYAHSGLSALYPSTVTKIFLFEKSTVSTTIWASLCWSTMSLEIVSICSGDKFSSLLKFSAATSWLRNPRSCMKSTSHFVTFCTSQIALKPSLLKISKLTFMSFCSCQFWKKKNLQVRLGFYESSQCWFRIAFLRK